MDGLNDLITNLFVPGISFIEKVVRPLLVYVFLVFILRIGGRRELGQLTTFDLVVLLTLSNTVQNAIIGNDNSVTGGIIGATTLLVANHFVVRLTYHHQKFAKVVEGSPTLLIDHGVIQKDALAQELITLDELKLSALKEGYDSLDEIDRAILDAGGAICYVAKKPAPEDVRHQELLTEIRRLSAQVAAIS